MSQCAEGKEAKRVQASSYGRLLALIVALLPDDCAVEITSHAMLLYSTRATISSFTLSTKTVPVDDE